MGYRTQFSGEIRITPQLPAKFVAEWNAMAGRGNHTYWHAHTNSFDTLFHNSAAQSERRKCLWKDSPNWRTTWRTEFRNNVQHAPSAFCEWRLLNPDNNTTHATLVWSGGHQGAKFYNYRAWAQYAVDMVADLAFAFTGVAPEFVGSIEWVGEDQEYNEAGCGDCGSLSVRSTPLGPLVQCSTYFNRLRLSTFVRDDPDLPPQAQLSPQLYWQVLSCNGTDQSSTWRVEPVPSAAELMDSGEPLYATRTAEKASVCVRGYRCPPQHRMSLDGRARVGTSGSAPVSLARCCLYGHRSAPVSPSSQSDDCSKLFGFLSPYPDRCVLEGTGLLSPLMAIVWEYVAHGRECSDCGRPFYGPATAWASFALAYGNADDHRVLGRYCSLSCAAHSVHCRGGGLETRDGVVACDSVVACAHEWPSPKTIAFGHSSGQDKPHPIIVRNERARKHFRPFFHS